MKHQKITLAVDTSSLYGSLSLLADADDKAQETLFSKVWAKPETHSEVITNRLDGILRENNYSLSQVQLLACTLGPGSFTGVRVGLNLMKTLSYTLNKPLYSENSLLTLAKHYSQKYNDKPIIVLMNAIKNYLYVAAYQDNEELLAPSALTTEKIESLALPDSYIVGNGFSLFQDTFSNQFNHRHQAIPWDSQINTSQTLVQRARKRIKQAQPYHQSIPLYIRNSEAEEKLKQGTLKPVTKKFEI